MRSNAPHLEADRFNAAVKVGGTVRYREIQDEGPGQLFKTRTDARVLSGHTAVVFLEGKTGCVCCSHCEPANDAQFITDRAAIEATFFDDQAADDRPTTPGLL